MALPRSCRFSTIVSRNAWRAGMSNALTMPWTTLSATIHGDRDAAAERERREREGLQHRQRLRDDQQAMTIPAIDEDAGDGPRRNAGNWPAKPTTPSSRAEPVSR